MINDVQKKVLVRAIELKVKDGEDAIEILKSYPNLTIAEKKAIGTEVEVEYAPTLTEAITEKITELSTACNKAIEDGVTIQIDGVDEHFSYGIASGDQSNIDSLFQLSVATNLNQAYHCDGGSCKLYTPEQIATLYIAQKMNTSGQQTYFNQIKHMIEDTYKEETDVDTVLNIVYGTPLTGQYLDDYNQIMSQNELIVKAVTASGSTISEDSEATA